VHCNQPNREVSPLRSVLVIIVSGCMLRETFLAEVSPSLLCSVLSRFLAFYRSRFYILGCRTFRSSWINGTNRECSSEKE
jgi:uncharacterized membrane protein